MEYTIVLDLARRLAALAGRPGHWAWVPGHTWLPESPRGTGLDEACLDLTNTTHRVAFRPWPTAVLAEAEPSDGRSPIDTYGLDEVRVELESGRPAGRARTARRLPCTCRGRRTDEAGLGSIRPVAADGSRTSTPWCRPLSSPPRPSSAQRPATAYAPALRSLLVALGARADLNDSSSRDRGARPSTSDQPGSDLRPPSPFRRGLDMCRHGPHRQSVTGRETRARVC